MRKSRVLWALWLVFMALFCVTTESVAGYSLLVVSVVLPLAAGFLMRNVGKKLQVELTADAYGEKEKEIAGRILVKNRSLLPVDRLICHIFCENLLTGEKETNTVRVAAPARACVETDIRFQCGHAGRIRLSVKQITYFDLFGLFRFRKQPQELPFVLTLIAPHTFSVETQIVYGESSNMDSDEYSMKKAGFDPSETFAIREYQPGDRVRQIHWKLTEKLDSLMVRDYGLPIQNTVLLLLETGNQPGSEEISPDCLDALAESLLSVSQELLNQTVVHSVGWFNHEENTFACEEVESEEELNSLLPEFLGAVPGQDELSVAEHYMETREQLEFAHVVVFTPKHRPNLAFLANQCLLTEVICRAGAAGYDHQDGMAMISAEPGHMEEILSYLEI